MFKNKFKFLYLFLISGLLSMNLNSMETQTFNITTEETPTFNNDNYTVQMYKDLKSEVSKIKFLVPNIVKNGLFSKLLWNLNYLDQQLKNQSNPTNNNLRNNRRISENNNISNTYVSISSLIAPDDSVLGQVMQDNDVQEALTNLKKEFHTQVEILKSDPNLQNIDITENIIQIIPAPITAIPLGLTLAAVSTLRKILDIVEYIAPNTNELEELKNNKIALFTSPTIAQLFGGLSTSNYNLIYRGHDFNEDVKFLGKILSFINIGVAFNKEDIGRLGKLSTSIISEYLIFRTINRTKINKTYNFVQKNVDKIMTLIREIDLDTRNKSTKEENLKKFICENSAITKKYNPFVKETILPIILQILSDKFGNQLFGNNKFELKHPELLFAEYMQSYKKYKTGEITPLDGIYFSIIGIIELVFSPLKKLSWGLSNILNNMTEIKSTIPAFKLIDKFTGFKLPDFCYSEDEPKNGIPDVFYKLASSIIGEVVANGIGVKMIETSLNDTWINYLLKNKRKFYELLENYQSAKNCPKKALVSWQESNLKIAEKELLNFIERGHKKEASTWTTFINFLSIKKSVSLKLNAFAYSTIIMPAIACRAAPMIYSILQVIFKF